MEELTFAADEESRARDEIRKLQFMNLKDTIPVNFPHFPRVYIQPLGNSGRTQETDLGIWGYHPAWFLNDENAKQFQFETGKKLMNFCKAVNELSEEGKRNNRVVMKQFSKGLYFWFDSIETYKED